MPFNVYAPAGQRVLAAWLFFHIAGQALLPVLLLTFLLTRVKRHPIFVNMLVSLVVTSVLCTMLWYKHRGFYAPESEVEDVAQVRFDRVCLAQASVVHHAIPPMVSLSAFALIFHVWTRVRTTVKPDPPHLAAFITLRTTMLLIAPYLAFALFGVAGSVITANNMQAEPPMVVLGLYCELQHDALGKVRAVFTAIVLLATALYEVRIIITLRRKSTGDMDGVERALFIRVVLFGAYVLLAFVLSIVSMITNTVASDLYISTVPMVVFLIFACQKDVLTAWSFWKRADLGHIRRPSLTPLWPKESA